MTKFPINNLAIIEDMTPLTRNLFDLCTNYHSFFQLGSFECLFAHVGPA
jgi:hypothetical protein